MLQSIQFPLLLIRYLTRVRLLLPSWVFTLVTQGKTGSTIIENIKVIIDMFLFMMFIQVDALVSCNNLGWLLQPRSHRLGSLALPSRCRACTCLSFTMLNTMTWISSKTSSNLASTNSTHQQIYTFTYHTYCYLLYFHK